MDNISYAKLNNLRISPRKVMLVASALRNKSYLSAKRILKFADKKAALPLLKLLESAYVNGKNKGFKESAVYVKEVLVGPGATLKRGRFVSRGGHHKILKRTANITIKLEKKEEGGKNGE
ncbi:50S ribosomal protein L22 [candidate division WWE3 bacterium CG09_land_8_20_14_0_10_39_24]|uniref:50S ribosomal protein L22 n=2 Tax=Katanobacteria TaxID=422282 RepID=A0A2G9XDE1_UNCKA|nr:MAG: hypothetical protein AUJ94_00755 [bacterium CG2_30_40_12]OJI08581.1 MAG: hypothetical protein BK003_02310 [bacterium CG09_39_24]PIP04503.1 MAG: 50S ribosomal protein L22 [candidate division WWE3 bacterium CG23_combo_of_CG06-09_8_20_14_all_40_14]PIS12749.1 MAG: 50S ribosomal protein L22 [candidate division WWE3 bacterium CG09_land_8_20_14_0_10_39_24]PJE52138.1 MAG: 50S ribosomal protein L22 [candidate division WWE3 bacterium CG10_big_fil_rev_8_21_14_0_10_39_14]